MKKVVIAGGTGFIGSYLARRFQENGFKVLIISRKRGHVSWRPLELEEAMNEAALIINLAGESINSKHSKSRKHELLASRVDPTIWIGNAIQACTTPPELWINASASGVYKASDTMPMTENKHDVDSGFLAELVLQWEKAFFGFKLPGTRQVALRTSIVLGKNGGALKPLATLTHFGLGGKQAEGTQMFSWIHIEDYFRIVLFLMKNPGLSGIFNCTSPGPVPNKEFMHVLRETLGVSVGIPAPKFAVTLGAGLIGTEPELILNSSYLLPERLQEAGYSFVFPTVEAALQDLLK